MFDNDIMLSHGNLNIHGIHSSPRYNQAQIDIQSRTASTAKQTYFDKRANSLQTNTRKTIKINTFKVNPDLKFESPKTSLGENPRRQLV